MANLEHLAKLHESVEVWNAWRGGLTSARERDTDRLSRR